MTKSIKPGHLDDEPTDPSTSKPRRRLLKLLRRSDTPLDVYQLAEVTGLHITTVRAHLDLLAKAGQVTVQKTPRTTRGRPRTVDTARTEEAPARRVPTARRLARRSPRSHPTHPPTTSRKGRPGLAASLIPTTNTTDPDETAHRIVDLFTEMNFDPELVDPAPATGEREIRLRACPYRDVAREHPDVVCAIHLGLLQGAHHPTRHTTHRSPAGAVRQTTPLPGLPDPRSRRYRRSQARAVDQLDPDVKDAGNRTDHRRGRGVRLARHGDGLSMKVGFRMDA